MAEKKPQTLENHAKFVPIYHMVAMPILLVNLIWSLYQLIGGISWPAVLQALVAFALIVVALMARVFTLTVQDRVIRLEMRLRLERLIPREQHANIDRLTVNQFVSLRFASDEELPTLFTSVLDGNLDDRKAIKKMIKNWTGDYLRA